MRTIKATDTIVITGWFRKRYWHVIPGIGVYELPVQTDKETKAKAKKEQNATAN